MNNEKRAMLSDVKNELERISEKLTMIYCNECSSYENLSEGLKASQLGESLEDSIEKLDDVRMSVSSAILYISKLA